MDIGPEYISKELDRWVYWNKVEFDYSRTAKPTDNTLIESFNSRFHHECLNEQWFMTLNDAREKIEKRRQEYTRKDRTIQWDTGYQMNLSSNSANRKA